AQPGRLVGWQSGHGHGSDRSSRLEKLDSGMELSYRCSWRHSPCLKSVTSSSLISAGVAAAFKSAHTPDLIVARKRLMPALTLSLSAVLTMGQEGYSGMDRRRYSKIQIPEPGG